MDSFDLRFKKLIDVGHRVSINMGSSKRFRSSALCCPQCLGEQHVGLALSGRTELMQADGLAEAKEFSGDEYHNGREYMVFTFW